ncbi:MAG: cell division topological specificity factor MinE [Defluviitaleaceae bacterium]|nr:cell division topological specificity factor MinE [Defluviitaleaceae bacterium]
MGFFGFFNKQSSSAKAAKSRLQMVLFNDRMNCSPQVLEMLKTDIIKVLTNYLEIDEENLDINISAPDGSGAANPVLTADIPIKSWKRKNE